jgi:hypothetical protein
VNGWGAPGADSAEAVRFNRKLLLPTGRTFGHAPRGCLADTPSEVIHDLAKPALKAGRSKVVNNSAPRKNENRERVRPPPADLLCRMEDLFAVRMSEPWFRAFRQEAGSRSEPASASPATCAAPKMGLRPRRSSGYKITTRRKPG